MAHNFFVELAFRHVVHVTGIFGTAFSRIFGPLGCGIGFLPFCGNRVHQVTQLFNFTSNRLV